MSVIKNDPAKARAIANNLKAHGTVTFSPKSTISYSSSSAVSDIKTLLTDTKELVRVFSQNALTDATNILKINEGMIQAEKEAQKVITGGK